MLDKRGQPGGSWRPLVVLMLAGLCAGMAVLHGMHALILLEMESALVALALAACSVLLSVTARNRE
jgi:hypothetical protein